MASQSALRNFSLPNRTGGRRPFSPSVGGEYPDRSESSAGYDHSHDLDDYYDRGNNRVRSPTPTALQLFHFSDDTAASLCTSTERSSMGRLRALPRPMSTSSSAPALTGVATAVATDVIFSPSQANTTHQNDNADIDAGPSQSPDRTQTIQVPSSPALSVWPRPSSAAGASPSNKKNIATEKQQGQDHGSERETVHGTAAADAVGGGNANDDSNNPPNLDRSISIRWGPRLRHIPLSEVQAADDAARRVAAVHRERRVFWALVGLALAGVLSCTAAVTLAAAQAAMQVGLDVVGLDMGVGGGGGPIWDARTLGWLVASLVVCIAATVGLAVATSARCRRRRDGGGSIRGNDGWWGETMRYKFFDKMMFSQGRKRNRGCTSYDRGNTRDICGGGSRGSHRFSALFSPSPPSNRPRRHGNEGKARDSRVGGGWVEMREMEEGEDSAGGRHHHRDVETAYASHQHPAEVAGHGGGAFAGWWPLRRKAKDGNNLLGNGNTNDGERLASATTAAATSAMASPTIAVCDEDRNWAKFSQDPVQLRRYVEGLEARLAVVEGVSTGAGDAIEGDSGGATRQRNTAKVLESRVNQQQQQQQQPCQAPVLTAAGLLPSSEPAMPASASSNRAGLCPSTSMRTTATAATAATTTTTSTSMTMTTVHPIMGGFVVDNMLGDSSEQSSHCLLLPPPPPSLPSSPNSLHHSPTSLRHPPSPPPPSPQRRRTRNSGSLSLQRELPSTDSRSLMDNSLPVPMPAIVPVPSDTQGSIIGQLYAAYAEERSPWKGR